MRVRDHLLVLGVGAVAVTLVVAALKIVEFASQWLTKNLPAEIEHLLIDALFLLLIAYVIGFMILDLGSTPAGGDPV